MPPRFRRFWHHFAPEDFEWDTSKREVNFERHGVDFPTAILVLRGEVLERLDTRHRSEARHQVIGETGGVVFFLVYAIRDGRCRIISIRQATADEADLYHDR